MPLAWLNWVWQAAALGVVAAVLLRGLHATTAVTRYRVTWAALAAILVLPLWPSQHEIAIPETLATVRTPAAPAAVATSPSSAGLRWIAGEALLAAWVAWVLFHTVQGAASFVLLRRMRRRCQPVAAELEAGLPAWTAVRTPGVVRLVALPDVPVAALLAGRPALIAVAPALLRRVAARDLDRIVLHEWAHARRGDHRAVILQYVVRTVVGWHPAVWWLDRRLHVEREIACDEMVVARIGDAVGYARCLTDLAEFACAQRDVPALAIAGPSGLRERVARLVETSPRPATARARAMGAVAMLAIAGGSASLAAVRLVDAVPVPETAARSRVEQPDRTRATVDAGRTTPAAGTGNRLSRPAEPLPAVALMRAQRDTPGRAAAAAADAHARVVQDVAGEADVAGSAERQEVAGGSPAVALPASSSAPAYAVVAGTARAAGPTLAAASYPVSLLTPREVPSGEAGRDRDAAPSDAEARADATPPWQRAGDGGRAVGRASRRAAMATAGWFTRLSRQAAQTF